MAIGSGAAAGTLDFQHRSAQDQDASAVTGSSEHAIYHLSSGGEGG
ncbi:MAG: hypothetical protein OJF52_003103 [Nitrospira sp.]|nr:MAG: hypothetical protein OJF52_003103 [Nitrospira sp.]